MANKVTIDVEARFVDNVTDESRAAEKAIGGIGKEADKTKKKVDELGKKKASPIFDADNNKFLNKVRSMEAKMKKLRHTKTAAVLDVVDKATTKIGNIMNKAQNFGRKTWQGLLKFKDSDALFTIKKVTQAAENLTKKAWTAMVKVKDMALAPIKAIKNALFSIPTLITAVVSAKIVQKAVLEPINLADAYSSAQIGFSTLLGESRGQQMMDEIDLFAKKTPFKTSGVISNVQKMMAYGWDVERVIDDMETIGDAAAATGKGDAGLESIVRALAEIRSKGKLSTQELNQLAGAGIKAKAYLAEGLGYGSSDAGMKKLAEDLEGGAIGANQAIDLILQGMKEFDGMMDKTANETVEGLKSQIEDAFEINIFRRWGQGLQDGAKRGFGSVVSLLDEADTALQKFGDILYEIGSNVSNWVADKFENAIERVMKITDSFEFKNASLGEKISMLWRGVIVDPLKEWWENGGQEKTAKTAGKIGKWMGETLTKGLLALFGMTDVLKEGGLDEKGGMSVAQSFAKGFVDGFDVSAITDKLLDAIKNVWNALPWWGKTLVGGYVGGKAISGVGNVIGGISNMVGGVSSASSFLSNGAANVGYWALGGKTAATLAGASGSTAALAGTATLAGGAATAWGMYKAATSAGNAVEHFQKGEKREGWADATRSGVTTLGMVGGGLAATAAAAKLGGTLGTFLGGPAGTLVGAGLGALVGWFAGDKIAKNIEAAKYESKELQQAIKDGDKSAEELAKTFEKAKWENAKEHFGDIKLSLEEIERLADQIVWGDDLEAFDKFTAATKNAEANLQSLKTASQDVDKWMWKAGLGVKFNEDEKEAFTKSIDDYINSATAYLDNAHYEFTASAELLLDLESEGGKSILESGNAFYAKEKEALDKAGKELGDALSKALEDGIINADEEKAILAAQEKIAKITERISNAEAEAEMTLIKVKWGKGNLDLESFENFMSTMNTTLEERMANADEALEVQIRNLNLRYPEKGPEYEKELQTIINGYETKIESIKAEVMGVELQIIGDAYAKELGSDAAKDLQNALEYAIENEIDPIEISDKKLCELLKVDDLSGETAANIKEMLSGVFGQIELIEVDGDILFKIGEVKTEEGTKEKVKNEVDKSVPKSVETDINVLLTGEKYIQNNIDVLADEFGIPDEKAKDILWKLSAEDTIVKKVEILAKEFGIKNQEAATILWKLTGQKSILNTFSLGYSDFGIRSSYSFSPLINVNARLGNVTAPAWKKSLNLDGSGYRGGIFGGSSAMEGFALGGRPDDGMLKGSTRFIRVNEESPEMIIPLSSQRRGRALKLWAKAGNIMGVPGFARGGVTTGGQDEGLRFRSYGSEESTGGQAVQVDIGGITFEIVVHGNDPQSITEAIKAQANEIAETVAGVLADALGTQFENTPARGGVA